MTGLLTLATVALLTVGPLASDAPVETTIELRALRAEQAIALHTRVFGDDVGAVLSAKPGARALIVRDTPARLLRFRALLRWLDQAGDPNRRIYVRPTRHRAPSQLAEVARRVLGDAVGPGVIMAPEDRSAQLVIYARPRHYTELDGLLRRLDVTPRGGRRIFVIPGQTSLPLPGRRK